MAPLWDGRRVKIGQWALLTDALVDFRDYAADTGLCGVGVYGGVDLVVRWLEILVELWWVGGNVVSRSFDLTWTG